MIVRGRRMDLLFGLRGLGVLGRVGGEGGVVWSGEKVEVRVGRGREMGWELKLEIEMG